MLLLLRGLAPLALLLASSRRAPAPRCCAAPAEDSSFAAYNLPPWLEERVGVLGFERPTRVQAEALGAVMEGRDAIVQAQTGSGKTLAYLLPLLATLTPQSSVQALVLCPSRELASQVALVARRLAAASPERLLVMALLDGSGAKRQRKWLLAQPPQLVVGNVQQVDAALKSRLLRLETLKMLVVDEVDACLAEEQTRALLLTMLSGQLAIPAAQQHLMQQQLQQQALTGSSASSARMPRRSKPSGGGEAGGKLAARQTLFVSATLPQRQHFRRQCYSQRWCREEPVLIHSEPQQVMPYQLRHGWAKCAPAKRVAALRVLLRRHEPELTGAIVFVLPSMPIRRIADALAGLVDEKAPPVLGEDVSTVQRAAAVRSLRDGSRRLLVSTHLGARGLDIPHCSHVYLLGLPESAEAYTHAAGRCGRMGLPGLVTVLASDKEEFALARLANELKFEFFDARDAE